MRKPRQVAVFLVAVVAIVASACTPKQAASPAVGGGGGYDVVIQNARVVDGTGDAWFNGDVAIQGDRIARVTRAGLLKDAPAKKRIDATGMVVAPGFIDIQGQSMMQLTFGDGRLLSKITQGVTTEIMGEGSSLAPVNPNILQAAQGMLASVTDSTVKPKLESFHGEHGFGAWLDAMQAHGMSTNAGSFLGAETIRGYAKGFAQGAPTATELDTMRAVTRNAMRDGAMGIASALIYPPGNFATTDELVEVAKAMSPLGGLYITHMRSEGDGFLEAIDEAMRIGREGNVPVEIFHLKAAGVHNWPKAKLAIAKIDSARAAGQDIQANMYPYIAGGTGLAACTPPWATEGGKLLENLKDAATRKKITTEMHQAKTTWENLCNQATPAGVMVMGFEKEELKKYEGKRLAEIAKDMKEDWADAVADILLQTEARIGMVIFLMNEDNVELQLKQPWLKIGTDADGEDPDSAKGLTHPRTYGTYPRILGYYVRERHVIPLEDAIRKMTSAVATRLSINDRGLLKEGMMADVVVFDPATIIDKATFTQPHQLSVGVKDVFVNGVQVLADGKHTGAKPGRIIRGPGWTGRTP
jgi:dihydroorotase/N-acyl-D-amino-acid deacylase